MARIHVVVLKTVICWIQIYLDFNLVPLMGESHLGANITLAETPQCGGSARPSHTTFLRAVTSVHVC